MKGWKGAAVLLVLLLMLGGILLSMHNIYYLLDLMRRAREAIIDGRYSEFVSAWMDSSAAADF